MTIGSVWGIIQIPAVGGQIPISYQAIAVKDAQK
jgi:hypothetical protein